MQQDVVYICLRIHMLFFRSHNCKASYSKAITHINQTFNTVFFHLAVYMHKNAMDHSMMIQIIQMACFSLQ